MKPIASSEPCRLRFVGRQDFLRAVERRRCWGGVYLLLIEGEGGIGKTALLEAILERTRPARETGFRLEPCVANQIIDFRHIDVHSVEALIRKVAEVLGEGDFTQTRQALDTLEQTRSGGSPAAIAKQARTVEAVFLAEFATLAERGVVLAFDTLDGLHTEPTALYELADTTTPVPSVGGWLVDTFLPALRGNVVVLLAGRLTPMRGHLERLARQHPQMEYQHVPLTPLAIGETRDYLQGAAGVLTASGHPQAAARLAAFSQAHGDTAHTLTGGKPLLVALVADLVAHGWTQPAAFASELKALQATGAEAGGPEVERFLVAQVEAIPAPLGPALRALAWLPRGATPELLARVMELRTLEGQWDIYAATDCLDRLADLTLVQLRASDRRVFLHDQLGHLLVSYLLSKAGEAEVDRVHAAIQAYYRERASDLARRLEQFPPRFSLLQTRLRQTLVEDMYYRLRHCPPAGFATYARLAEDALSRRDAELDLLLRAELIRTADQLSAAKSLQGLNSQEVEMEVALRWASRTLLLDGDAPAALQLLDWIETRWRQDAAAVGLAWTHLWLCQARALIHRGEPGDWSTAHDLLADVVQVSDGALYPSGHRLQARLLQAVALHARGTLARLEGRFLVAVQHYQAAAILLRRLEMWALTPTLIELAHVMAQTGQVHAARLLAQEAERRSQRASDEATLALARHVRAVVEIHDNHPRDALRYASQALHLARRVHEGSLHGAIHLTRARARLQLWESFGRDQRHQELTPLLEALQDVDLAVNLLGHSPAAMVDALLERAGIHRAVALWHDWQGRDDEADRAATRSHDDAQEAAGLAAALDLPGQQALAWLHRAWLHYHLKQTTLARARPRRRSDSPRLLPTLPCPGLAAGRGERAVLDRARPDGDAACLSGSG
jgi:hypothetical protein